MEVLIKLSDAIKTLKSMAVPLVRKLPSAQPEPQWIPCSEKLPENGHYYLWCSDGGNVQSDYYWDGFENGKKFGYNIIAWMPLPKPYKGEQE